METSVIHDRGLGPEIAGTRITVYHLLPYFLDPTATESYVCRLYNLSPEQIAAARAYVLNNFDTVMARHRAIEERIAAGNPPQVNEQAERTHAAFVAYRNALIKRRDAGNNEEATGNNGLPTFREWFGTNREFMYRGRL